MPAAKRGAKRLNWAESAAALPGARAARLKVVPFAPQLATLGDNAPVGEQWIHEIKWDGYRLVGVLVDGKATLWSRNALVWTAKVPRVVAALERLGVQQAAFDGELIAGGGTQADFNLLQAVLSGEVKAPLAFVLFDLLHLEGVSIERAPLVERKALLARLLAKPPAGLAYSTHVAGDGAGAFSAAAGEGFEGIISKRADRPYVHGRGADWQKTKHLPSDEFAVVGYTPPKGSRTGFGSLLLARPDPKHGWRYTGRVGSGFSDELIRSLAKHLLGGQVQPTVHVAGDRASLKGATWFEPRFVAEVFLRGTGNSGLLRQPSLKAIRPDKSPRDLLPSKSPAKRRR